MSEVKSLTDVSTELDASAFLLVAAVASATIGVLFYNVMPLYLGALQDATSVSNSRIGFVASAFFLGFNLISASSFFWVRKFPIRLTSFLILGALWVLLGLSAFIANYPFILIATIIVGGCSGALAAIGATIIGDSDRAARWYGIKTAAESGAGVLLLFVLPATLMPQFGFKGTVLGMLLLIAAIAPTFLFLMKGRLKNSNEVDRDVGATTKVAASEQDLTSSDVRTPIVNLGSIASGIVKHKYVWLALGAMVLFFAGGSAVWAFEERIASSYNFDPVWVGQMLGFSLFFAVVGPLAASAAGARFGYRVPFLLAAILMIVGVLSIAASSQAMLLYAIGACTFMLGWGGGLPFLFAKIAADDPDGRHIALAVPALGIGSMIGPGLAGLMYSGGSIAPLQWLSVSTITLAIICMWGAGKSDHATSTGP